MIPLPRTSQFIVSSFAVCSFELSLEVWLKVHEVKANNKELAKINLTIFIIIGFYKRGKTTKFIYFQPLPCTSAAEAVDALLSFPTLYNLSKRELYEKIIKDVMEGNAGNIHPDVYKAYSDNLRKAVGGVFPQGKPGDPYFDLEAQLQANVTRFAAYKAWHLTEQLKKQREKWPGDDDFRKVAKAVLNTFNRYQAAEYNTATARARTAKQWTDFTSDPIANELYPNLKWLPSRSANPREEHMVFYNRVWAKSDPFWSENQPGDLWNCKCDWEETDDPVTDGNPTDAHHAKGLEGNPAETGEIFTKECTYIRNAPRDTEKLCRSTNRNTIAKEGKELNQNRRITYEIDGTEHDFDFRKFKKDGEKVDICRHYAASMFGDGDYWLKNEILLNPQHYLDNGTTISNTAVDPHNTGVATQKLKDATDRFFYIRTRLANGNAIILHVGRYKESGKLYLYSASKELPEYARTSQ